MPARTCRRVVHTLLLAALLIVPLGAHRAASSGASHGIDPTAKLPPEVRLRKLHLVRPDLIQYPIDFEVYC